MDIDINNDQDTLITSPVSEPVEPVLKVEKLLSGRYQWNKKKCCKFCKTMVVKVYRHIESCHLNEKEVQEMLKLPKKDPGRRML